MSNSTGPVISTELYDSRTRHLCEEVEERMKSLSAMWVDTSSGSIAAAIREAYNAGLTDGFAQGVYSAHADK